MKQTPANIQIIADGNGSAMVLEDGKVIKSFCAEYSIPREFIEWIEQRLVEYPRTEEEE